MAIRNDFTAGEVLAAADLNDTFNSKVPYAYGTATPSTTVDGFVWYDENETPPAPKFWDGAAFQALGGGKVLQVVRATDTGERSTTSTSYVDVTGMTITITPQKSDSAIILLSVFRFFTVSSSTDDLRAFFAIADSSNNLISGAQDIRLGSVNITGTGTREFFASPFIVAYATPATTSAVTYKTRFRSNVSSTTTYIGGSGTTSQMYAIEVSA